MIHKDVLLTFGGLFNHAASKKRFRTGSLIYLAQEAFVALSCFLIGRAVLFEEIAPFGIALFAVLLYKRMGGFSAFLAVTAGLLSYRFGSFAVRYILVMMLFSLIWWLFNIRNTGWTRLRLSIALSLSLFAMDFIFSFIDGILAYEILLALLESVVAFIMVYIFSQASDVLLDSKRRSILSGEEIICISIFLSLLVIGFWDAKLLSLSLRNIFSVFMIMLLAYIGGTGAGASVGITVGFILSLASSPDPVLMGSLAVCGLLAGLFKELGRAGSGIAFMMANVLMTFYINQSTFVILPFMDIAAAAVLVMLFPKKGITYLKQFLDYKFMKSRDQEFYVNRMQELIVGRLNEFAQVFRHLSRAFGRVSDRSAVSAQEELSELFGMVASEVCSGCALKRSCWERDFYNTYTNLYELLTVCESKGRIDKDDVPQEISRRCFNKNGLVDAVNNKYAVYLSNLKWRKEILECRQLAAEQLDGISRVVKQLAAELDMDIRFKKDMEEAIHLELDRAGIRAKDVLVLEKEGGKIEVCITKEACGGNRECSKKVGPIVSKVLGRPMSNVHNGCTQAGRKDCTLQLAESRQFEVITGLARKPKSECNICGDSYSFISVKDGKYLLALSDGMGFGARAAEESSAVVSLLESFMEAGFDQNITIRSINSMLMLRSQEEVFATADLCILDLVGAGADFIKIGGAPSFIRRGGDVEVIRQSTLPIGILEDVQMKDITVQISDDDIIVMVTDGILDAFSMSGNGEQLLAGFIATLDTTNPQEIADSIMEEALMHADGEAKDDMTAMVARIWKPY